MFTCACVQSWLNSWSVRQTHSDEHLGIVYSQKLEQIDADACAIVPLNTGETMVSRRPNKEWGEAKNCRAKRAKRTLLKRKTNTQSIDIH